MGNEFVARYEGRTHRELFNMVKAGNPDQVETIATQWRGLQESASQLSAAVSADLGKVASGWKGDAGQEYRRRVDLIASYASTLSEDLDQVQLGLRFLATPLREAQKQAEDPAATEDNDKAISGGAKGALLGLPAGPAGMLVTGTVGALFGHQQDEEEKEKARQRMVQLVANLATEYETVTTGIWPEVAAEPPADLPHDASGLTTVVSQGIGARVSAGPSLGKATSTGQTTTSSSTPSGTALAASVSADGPAGTGTGTSLLGAGSAVVGSGLLTTAAMGGILGVGPLAGTANLGPGLGRGGGGLPGGGSGRGLLSGTGAASAAGGPNDAVLGGREQAQAGRQSGAATGRSGVGATGRGAAGTEEEPDERLTWLTEDEMVWGDGASGGPAVLGGGEPTST